MTIYSGVSYGEHRRADEQTSCDSARSRGIPNNRTVPLFITGYTVKDAALGEPRIRAGEIIGWRIWRLYDGLLQSVVVSYIWRPGVFERSSSQEDGWRNFGYHAFRDKEQAEREASVHWSPIVIGSVAMWGEVIEHQQGWRSNMPPCGRSSKLLETFAFGVSIGCCLSCAKSTAAAR
jgi:hypothetical protein